MQLTNNCTAVARLLCRFSLSFPNNKKLQQQASAAIVSQPMIGGTESKREGPWPDCVGLEGPTCVRIIETYAEDLRGHVFIIEPDTMVTADFDTDRVRVWVNASSIVIKIPKRG